MALHLGQEPDALRLLRGMRLQTQRSFRGAGHGERVARQRGVSIEFRDHREYGAGDDLRHLDWNALARLDSAVIKTYRDNQDLLVSIWIDQTDSMSFGEPTKAELARQLGCAIGMAGLQGGDSVQLRALGGAGKPSPTLRGVAQAGRMAAFVEQSAGGGDRSLVAEMKFGLANLPRPGVVVILSDGLEPDVARIVELIGGRRSEPIFVQILADSELDPDLEGDLRLVDSEGNGAREVTANRSAVASYRKNLQDHLDGIAAAVTRAGGRHAVVKSSQSAREVIQSVFIKRGWIG